MVQAVVLNKSHPTLIAYYGRLTADRAHSVGRENVVGSLTVQTSSNDSTSGG